MVVHEAQSDEDTNSDQLEQQLKTAVIRVYGSAKACFEGHSKGGAVNKKEWKKILRKVLPALSQIESKSLRKQLPNKLSMASFCAFIGETEKTKHTKGTAKARSTEEQSSGLAELPPEVPRYVVEHTVLLYFVAS